MENAEYEWVCCLEHYVLIFIMISSVWIRLETEKVNLERNLEHQVTLYRQLEEQHQIVLADRKKKSKSSNKSQIKDELIISF